MIAEHQRWYDKEPTLSLAVSLLRNAKDGTRSLCADMIISFAKDLGVQIPNDIFSNFNYVLKRWYDEDKKLSEALEYLKNSPDELKREIAYKMIEFLEKQEMQNI